MEAIKKIFEIDLDVKRATTSRTTNKVKQGDNGNIFIITMTHDGEPIDLTGTKILAVFSKTNGTAQQDNEGHGITIDPERNNVIIVELYTTSFAPGIVECEIQILSGENYGTLITSARFNFECDRAIINDETLLATNEYPILAGLISRVEEAEGRLVDIEANENARVESEEDRIAAETARVEAETAREQAELLREQEEADRITDEQIRIGNEATRNEAENQRYLAESGRVSAERARAEAETTRATAEATRQQNEATRVTAETSRVTAENARASAEAARANAETARERKWNNPTATATTLDAGAPATATVNFTSDSAVFTFGIPQGLQGIQGERGEKGDTGSGLKVLGYYETIIDLETYVQNPDAGDAYGVGDAEPYDIYIWDGVNEAWVNNGPLQGEKGDTGPAGYTPIKYTDYWTPTDKAEMVADVLAALPTYGGEINEL